MNIDGVTPKNRFFLGPMAGVTDSAFRTVCARRGAGLTYTEMVSAKALTYGDKKTRALLAVEDEQRPCVAQIFGSEPEVCAEGARIALAVSGAEMLDINMGCPMPKITQNGEGSALMRTPELAARIIEAVAKAVPVPVTVKFRSGFNDENRNAVAFARMAQESGARMICVHGRTREQYYGGTADMGIVREVKQAVRVPVIVSGDAMSAQRCLAMLDETGADAAMIARGALGAPQIFAQCLALERGETPEELTLESLVSAMLEHMELACARKGEVRAIPELRKHALWYLGRLRGAKHYKLQMSQVKTAEEFGAVCAALIADGVQVKG